MISVAEDVAILRVLAIPACHVSRKNSLDIKPPETVA